MKTDYKRVAGLGSARHGTGHWWGQRLTSVAMIPLTLLFIFPFGRAVGGGREMALETYGNPFDALVAMLFIAAVFAHARQGLQVVIEDYTQGALRTALLALNTLLCAGLALAGIFALALIAIKSGLDSNGGV